MYTVKWQRAKTQANAEENTLVLTKHTCISVFCSMVNIGLFLPHPCLVFSVTVGALMEAEWRLEIWRLRAQVPFRAQAGVVLSSPEVNSSVTLVNSQLVCLLAVETFNHVTVFSWSNARLQTPGLLGRFVKKDPKGIYIRGIKNF